MSFLENDKYGRAVELKTDGIFDTYRVTDNTGLEFSVTFRFGTSFEVVYYTINAMAPAGYVEPEVEG